MVRRSVLVGGICEAVCSLTLAAASSRICWGPWVPSTSENKNSKWLHLIYAVKTWPIVKKQKQSDLPAFSFMVFRTFRRLMVVGSPGWECSPVLLVIREIILSVVILALQPFLFLQIQYEVSESSRLHVYEYPSYSSIVAPRWVFVSSIVQPAGVQSGS